jgi:hypothetical protein
MNHDNVQVYENLVDVGPVKLVHLVQSSEFSQSVII